MKKFLFISLLFTQTLSALIARKDVPEKDRWNVEAMYASLDDCQQDLQTIVPHIPEASLNRGLLAKSYKYVLDTLATYYSLERKLTKVAVYSHLRHYEDVANNDTKTLLHRVTNVLEQFSKETAWIQPELLALPDDLFISYIHHPELAQYKIELEKLLRLKAHVRSIEEEELIARLQSTLDAPGRIHQVLQNADYKYGPVLDSQGTPHELTPGQFGTLLESEDRLLRKNAFLGIYAKQQEHENSLAELFLSHVKAHHFTAEARRYNSCLEAALAPNNIDPKVYHSLIEATHSRIELLHRYMALRKKTLQVDELHPYDLHVPLVKGVDKKYSFDEAVGLVLDAVKPLGKEYQSLLKNGLINDRWVDRYESQNKRSGAFSSGCFDSMPYILMNFSGCLRDVFTLVHESGHSMHSLFSIRNQPYITANYSIFVAEVASIFNEQLLRHNLLSQAKTNKEKAYILNQALEDIRGTLFRQVLYAEFELFAHTCVEQNIPLTLNTLKNKYAELYRYYNGPDVAIDPEVALEWSRVPHFFYNFYVYQYATGISCALNFADSVLSGTDVERERYLGFLKAGSSDYPLNVLEKAGCDMRTTAPVLKALDQFEAYLNEFEKLLESDSSL